MVVATAADPVQVDALGHGSEHLLFGGLVEANVFTRSDRGLDLDDHVAVSSLSSATWPVSTPEN